MDTCIHPDGFLTLDWGVSLVHFTKDGRDIGTVENVPNISFVPVVTLKGQIKVKANFDQETILDIPDESYEIGN